MLTCPVCLGQSSAPFFSNRGQRYSQCPRCECVFVPEGDHLGLEAEKSIYDLHQNDSSDEGYRAFLNRLAQPLLEILPRKSEGLDFGSGPGPTLSLMLEEEGHKVRLFDPFYCYDQDYLNETYHFITMTEVAEHLASPKAEFERLFSLLKPQGLIAVMTSFRPQKIEEFASWHYHHDPTHITFYSEKTFSYLASVNKAQALFPAPNVCFLRLL
jgi:hypothetical protein